MLYFETREDYESNKPPLKDSRVALAEYSIYRAGEADLVVQPADVSTGEAAAAACRSLGACVCARVCWGAGNARAQVLPALPDAARGGRVDTVVCGAWVRARHCARGARDVPFMTASARVDASVVCHRLSLPPATGASRVRRMTARRTSRSRRGVSRHPRRQAAAAAARCPCLAVGMALVRAPRRRTRSPL
jgi:hypothetical protein